MVSDLYLELYRSESLITDETHLIRPRFFTDLYAIPSFFNKKSLTSGARFFFVEQIRAADASLRSLRWVKPNLLDVSLFCLFALFCHSILLLFALFVFAFFVILLFCNSFFLFPVFFWYAVLFSTVLLLLFCLWALSSQFLELHTPHTEVLGKSSQIFSIFRFFCLFTLFVFALFVTRSICYSLVLFSTFLFRLFCYSHILGFALFVFAFFWLSLFFTLFVSAPNQIF